MPEESYTTCTYDRIGSKTPGYTQATCVFSTTRNVLTGNSERLLKHLATADVVRETGPDEYAANAVTKVLATPEAAGMVIDW
jgi:hypothetical protein